MTMKSIIKSVLGDVDNEVEEKKKDDTTKNVFIICPVRGATEEEHNLLMEFIRKKETEGIKVHYPPRDTNQDDPVGYAICAQNREAIKNADKIYVYWNSKSEGSLFDLGMAFAMNKPIELINPSEVRSMVTEGKKSFQNVLVHLDSSNKQ